jgi:hypothetical protein
MSDQWQLEVPADTIDAAAAMRAFNRALWALAAATADSPIAAYVAADFAAAVLDESEDSDG